MSDCSFGVSEAWRIALGGQWAGNNVGAEPKAVVRVDAERDSRRTMELFTLIGVPQSNFARRILHR